MALHNRPLGFFLEGNRSFVLKSSIQKIYSATHQKAISIGRSKTKYLIGTVFLVQFFFFCYGTVTTVLVSSTVYLLTYQCFRSFWTQKIHINSPILAEIEGNSGVPKQILESSPTHDSDTQFIVNQNSGKASTTHCIYRSILDRQFTSLAS